MTARLRLIVFVAMALTAAFAAYLHRPLREATGFLVPSKAEFRAAQDVFGRALRGEGATGLAVSANRLGLSSKAVGEPGWAGLALAEPPGQCHGRGAYLLRQGEAIPLAVTAPHRGSDRHTGDLASLLFAERPLAAAAWNSAPRRAGQGCAGGDVTRKETHYFTAFALAFAAQHPGGRVVQLHGFDRHKRQSEAGRTSDIIVSDGSGDPGELLLDLADCLSLSLAPLQVAVYPIDAHELGGLSNRQGRALRKAGFKGFVHLEIAAELRRRLVTEPELRGRFSACLVEGLS